MVRTGIPRRKVLTGIGGSALALTAGCVGGGGNDGGSDGGSGSGGDGSGGSGGDGGESGSESQGSSFPQDGDEVRLIIPYGTGGGFDTYSRGLAPYFEKHLDADVSVLPENVEGGGGARGTNEAYNAAPDGKTIEMFHGTNFPLQELLGDVAYKTEDFVFFGQVAYNVKTIVSARDGGAETWDEMVSKAQDEGVMRISTGGNGSPAHIAMAVVVDGLDGVEAQYVHYGGVGEAMTAIARDEADYTVANYSSAVPFTGEGGEVKYVFALNSDQPAEGANLALAPDLGVPNWQTAADLVNTIRAFVLPPGTPDDVQSTWESALLDSLEDEEFLAWAKENERPITAANGETVRERTMNAFQSMKDQEELLNEMIDL